MVSGQEWIQKEAEKCFLPEGEKAGNVLLFQADESFRIKKRKEPFLEPKQQNQFRKARKIKRKKEIYGLFKAKERWHSEWCSVFYSENEKNRNRCAIIVPKTIGTAVERNRIKRRVREYFRNFLKSTPRHIDVLIKIHPAKEVKNIKHRLEKALALWYETLER